VQPFDISVLEDPAEEILLRAPAPFVQLAAVPVSADHSDEQLPADNG
jgi:hypothetical protein